MNEKLTVILISYNEAEYLRQSIESILNQTYKNMELIIIDDGSSDGSIDIIKDYEKKYPDLIKHFVMNRNDGVKLPSLRVSNSLKFAFSKSTGDYFALLSGDDYFCDNNKLENDIKVLRKKNIVATVSDFNLKYEDKEVAIKNFTPMGVFWSGDYAHISCFTFKRECLKNILNNFCDDTGLIYSIMCTGKFKYTKKISFNYRQRGNSIVHNSTKLENDILELLLFDDILEKNGKFKKSTLSRFKRPLCSVYDNREIIKNEIEKYNFYIDFENINKFKYKMFYNLIYFDNLTKKQQTQTKRILKNAKFYSSMYSFRRKIHRKFFIFKEKINGDKKN